jgi:CBS-domain-containing membrane protein
MDLHGTATHPVGKVTARLVSTRTVVEKHGSAKRTLHVLCPMHDRVIGVERCVECPMCVRLDASEGSVGRPSVACSFETPSARSRTVAVGSALTRFATCVRADAIGLELLASSRSGSLPVVDEHERLVGVLESGLHLRADAGTQGLAIEEHMPVSKALAHMARHKVRQVPVVARDGTVVGVLDDLDAMRALRGVAPG